MHKELRKERRQIYVKIYLSKASIKIYPFQLKMPMGNDTRTIFFRKSYISSFICQMN